MVDRKKPDPNSPFYSVQVMRENGAPVWQQYVAFAGVVSRDPNWFSTPDEVKKEAYQKNFGVDDPRELLKSEESVHWAPPGELGPVQQVTNAYLQTVPDFQQRNNEERQQIADNMLNLWSEKHADSLMARQMEHRIRAQEAADEQAAQEQAVQEFQQKAPFSVEEADMGLVPPPGTGRVEVPELEQFVEPPIPQDQVQVPATRQIGNQKRYNDVVKMWAEDPAFEGEPDKAEFMAGAWLRTTGNPYWPQASMAERNETINGFMDTPEGRELFPTTADRIKFRLRLARPKDGGPAPPKEKFDIEQPDGFWENLAVESKRGLMQLDEGWTGSIEIGLKQALVDMGVYDSIEEIGGDKDLERIARLRRKGKEDMPQELLGELVYSGEATEAERAMWLAKVTYNSLVAFGPAIPTTIAAGYFGGPAAVGATSAMASGMLEYGPSIIDFLADNGVDVEDADALLEAFTNENLMADARSWASLRSMPIMALDGFTALVGAKLGASKAAAQRAARKAGTKLGRSWWRELAAASAESGAGGLGEGLAQWFTTGKVDDWNAIIAEMVGEVPTAGVDFVAGQVSERGESARQSRKIDISDIGREFGGGTVPGDTTPTPNIGAADKATVDEEDGGQLTAEDVVAPRNLGEGETQYYDGLDDETKVDIKRDATEEWNRRVAERMEEYGLGPDEIAQFPENELEQIGAEAFSDVLNEYRSAQGAQEQEAEAAKPAPKKVAQEEPVRPISVTEFKSMLKEAKTNEEIDVLEREWQDRGKTDSKAAAKAVLAARRRVRQADLESVGDQDTEEDLIDLQRVKEQRRVGDLSDDAVIRFKSVNGAIVDGTIRADLSEDGVVAVQLQDGSFEYLDENDDVGVIRDYTEEPKPRRKPPKRKPSKKKAAHKPKTPPRTFEQKANYVDTETGELVIAERMFDGNWVIEDATGKLTEVGETELPPTYVRKDQVGVAQDDVVAEDSVVAEEPVVQEEADEDIPRRRAVDQVEEDFNAAAKKSKVSKKNTEKARAFAMSGMGVNDIANEDPNLAAKLTGPVAEATNQLARAARSRADFDAALDDVTDEMAEDAPVVDVVGRETEIPDGGIARDSRGAPAISAMKKAADEATTIERLDDLLGIETTAVEDGLMPKARKSVLAKIEKKRAELDTGQDDEVESLVMSAQQNGADTSAELGVVDPGSIISAIVTARTLNGLADEQGVDISNSEEANRIFQDEEDAIKQLEEAGVDPNDMEAAAKWINSGMPEKAKPTPGGTDNNKIADRELRERFSDLVGWVKSVVRMDNLESPTMHGMTGIENLRSILSNGLRKGTAIGHTGWVHEFPVIVNAPTAEKGAYVKHNDYYKSSGDAEVTEVIVREDEFNASVWPDMVAELKALQKEFPDVSISIVMDDDAGSSVNVSEYESSVATDPEVRLKQIEAELEKLEVKYNKKEAQIKKLKVGDKKRSIAIRQLDSIADEANELTDEYLRVQDQMEEAEGGTAAEGEPSGAKPAPVEKNESGTPKLNALKKKVDEATTHDQLDAIEATEQEAVDAGLLRKPRASLVTKIKKKREALGKKKPKKATPNKKAQANNKKTREATKKPGKSPKDPAKDKQKEAKPKPKPKKSARKSKPEQDGAIPVDRNGAALIPALKDIVKTTESAEVVEAVEDVYISDIKHGRRKRRNKALENLINDRLGQIFLAEEQGEPVPEAPKEERKKKETEEEATERMMKQIEAPWPWWREDSIEEEFAYMARLDDDKLADEIVQEIQYAWNKLNGINDFIDPSFVEQVLREAEKINPNVSNVRDAVYNYLENPPTDEEMASGKYNENAERESLIDPNFQVRLFLAQEYPGVTTLMEASGLPISKMPKEEQARVIKDASDKNYTLAGSKPTEPTRIKVSMSPRAEFSRWLEKLDVAVHDEQRKVNTEEVRAATKKAKLTVKDSDKSDISYEDRIAAAKLEDEELGISLVIQQELRGEGKEKDSLELALEAEKANRLSDNPDANIPNNREEAERVIEMMKAQEEIESDIDSLAKELEDILRGVDLDQETKTYMSKKLASSILTRVTDLKKSDIERLYSPKQWRIWEYANGWILKHRASGAQLGVIIKSGEQIVRDIATLDERLLGDLAKVGGLEKYIETFLHNRAVAMYEIEKSGKTDKRLGILGFFGKSIDGNNAIALDEDLAGNHASAHEAWHFFERRFLDQKEKSLLKSLFSYTPRGLRPGTKKADKRQKKINSALQLAEENRADWAALYFSDEQSFNKKLSELPDDVLNGEAGTIRQIFEKAKQFFKNMIAVFQFKGINKEAISAIRGLSGKEDAIRLFNRLLDDFRSGEAWADYHASAAEQLIGVGVEPFLVTPDNKIVQNFRKYGRVSEELEKRALERIAAAEEESAAAQYPEAIPDTPLAMQVDSQTRGRGVRAAVGNPKQLKAIEKRRAARLKKAIKKQFSRSRGVPPGLYKLFIESNRANSSAKVLASAANNRMKNVVKQLKSKYGEDRVSRSLAMVLDGRMPVSQFARIYGLRPDDKALESIKLVLDRQAEVRNQLSQMPNLTEDLRKLILANEYYQTRFYAVHVLGNGYIAESGAFQNAVDAMFEAHTNEVERILAKAGDKIGKKEPFDFGKFMFEDHAGRERMLAGLAKTKKAAMIRLAHALDPWMGAVTSIEVENGSLSASWNEQLLEEIAIDTVNGYLDNAANRGRNPSGPIGGIPAANRMHRTLDKVFRDLYGEIDTPGDRLARTIEVQANLLSSSMLFQKIFEEGESKWWSAKKVGRFTKRLSESQGFGSVTPQDHAKFGAMAGKFVTEETYDLLMGENIDTTPVEGIQYAYKKVWDTFQKIQAITRGTRLLWWKTVARNAITSVTGFALGNGDALEKGWSGYMKEGVDLMMGVLDDVWTGNNPKASETLAQLIKDDVFDVSQETILNAIQANLKGIDLGGGKYSEALKRSMTSYALIDLPAKYAAYKVRLDKGDTKAQAVEHIHKFYQYRESVPDFISSLNRFGLGDYFGYTWDSTRIWKNQIVYAAQQAAAGNARPLVGLTMRLGSPFYGGGTGSLSRILLKASTASIAAHGAFNLLSQMLSGDDEGQDEELFRVATEAETAALREALPSYDRYQPLIVWYERDSVDDGWTLKWKVLGNLSAFPLEDIILGAYQASAENPDLSFAEALGFNLLEASPFTPGMTIQNLATLLHGGSEIMPSKNSVGVGHIIADAVESGTTEKKMMSDWDIKMLERVGQFLGESFAPGQTYRFFDKAAQVAFKRDPMVGRMRTSVEWEDALNTIWRLVRSYDVEPQILEKTLGDMVSSDIQSYLYEKYQAGTAGRADVTWEQGHNSFEEFISERGREGWHHALKVIQKKVVTFRTLSAGQVSDNEIEAYLKDRGLRKAEARYIVEGSVEEMKAEDFTFDHQAPRTQRGDGFIMDYFDEKAGGPIYYRELYDRMKEEKYIVGDDFPKFRARAKGLRREWNKNRSE